MVLDIELQRRAIEGRLDYYKDVIPSRDASYAHHKLGKIIPRLRRALQKISEGSYGACDDCEEKIPEERLRLIPGATQCVDCKSAEE